MLARSLAKYVVFCFVCHQPHWLWFCLGQVTDLTGIGAHLRANRCGARLVKTVNSCKGKTVGCTWVAVHSVPDSLVPLCDRYRLGHQPVTSTWPLARPVVLRVLSSWSVVLRVAWRCCCDSMYSRKKSLLPSQRIPHQV